MRRAIYVFNNWLNETLQNETPIDTTFLLKYPNTNSVPLGGRKTNGPSPVCCEKDHHLTHLASGVKVKRLFALRLCSVWRGEEANTKKNARDQFFPFSSLPFNTQTLWTVAGIRFVQLLLNMTAKQTCKQLGLGAGREVCDKHNRVSSVHY